MIIVDAHQDIAYNAVCFGRDYTRAALAKRRFEAQTTVPEKNGIATLGLPEATAGRVALVFATLFVAPRSAQSAPWDLVTYDTPREAHQLALQQMDYYQRLADSTDRIRLVRTQAELEGVLATWEAGQSVKDRQQGLVILMENADPILEPRELEAWYERGVRIIGPAWKATRYCGGTGEPGGLTRLGRELLQQMAALNMVLDLSHMAEQAYSEALDYYAGASIIASHSNPRRFRNTDRHLSDSMIKRLAERDGVIGVVLANHFLRHDWNKGDAKNEITLAAAVAVIDTICQLTGSAAHAGIGSDFDGGFGAESIPAEIDTVGDLWRIGESLRTRGYSAEDIEAILGNNMLRKVRQGLPTG